MTRPWPILGLVGGLALAMLAMAQTVSFAVIAWWPAPSAPTAALADAIALLSERAPSSGNGLRLRVQNSPPDGTAVPVLVAVVADALHRSPERVRAVWKDHRFPSVQIVAAGRVAGSDAAHDPAVRAALLAPGLRLPAFEIALQQDDGRWRLVTTDDIERSRWQRQVIIALLLGAVLIAPLAWLLAQRLTGPLRRLAAASAEVDLSSSAALPEHGAQEVRALASAINQARERLQRQAAEVTAMLAAVAHDLRTPLTGLRLRAENAAESDRDYMVADIARMQAMITQMLDYARGEAGPLQRDRVAIDVLVRELVEPQRALGHAVAVDAEAASVCGDALILRRAIGNLIDNAIRYGGRADIVVRVVDDDVVIEVADRGPGIPDAQRERLLLPFQRLDDSRNRATGGSGLGLAVVRSAARRHGGTLSLDDRDGGGLCARLVLPMTGPGA